jgi:hypothetical protein
VTGGRAASTPRSARIEGRAASGSSPVHRPLTVPSPDRSASAVTRAPRASTRTAVSPRTRPATCSPVSPASGSPEPPAGSRTRRPSPRPRSTSQPVVDHEREPLARVATLTSAPDSDRARAAGSSAERRRRASVCAVRRSASEPSASIRPASPRADRDSRTIRPPSIRPRPSAVQGPVPWTERPGVATVSVPVTLSSAVSSSTRVSIRPDSSVPGASAAARAPSIVAAAVAHAPMGERRSSRPRISMDVAPEAIRASSTSSVPPSSASLASALTGFTRRPPCGHPTAPSASRTAIPGRPPAPRIAASSRPRTSHGALFASRSSSRPSRTSAWPSRASTRHGCAAKPVAGGFSAFGWPVSVTTIAGRRRRTPRPSARDQEASTACASSATPSRRRLTAVAVVSPWSSRRSSVPIRSVPPTACDPHFSISTRTVVPPSGVWTKVRSRTTSRRPRAPRLRKRRSARLTQVRGALTRRF